MLASLRSPAPVQTELRRWRTGDIYLRSRGCRASVCRFGNSVYNHCIHSCPLYSRGARMTWSVGCCRREPTSLSPTRLCSLQPPLRTNELLGLSNLDIWLLGAIYWMSLHSMNVTLLLLGDPGRSCTTTSVSLLLDP